MEIVQERLQREYELSIINTVPTVEYHINTTDGEQLLVDNPSLMPDVSRIESVEEPFVKASIVTPSEYIGNLMKLCLDRRGVYRNTEYIDAQRASLHYEIPLSEIIFDFFDKMKSVSRGYASLDYEFLDYRISKLVKLDILLNDDPVDALSYILHHRKGVRVGTGALPEASQADSSANVRGRHSGRDWQPHYCPRIGQAAAQERDRQMLRRRYHPQTQAPRTSERGQEADEAGRPGGNPARSVFCDFAGGKIIIYK